MIVSRTGQQRGRGCDPYKWVAWLSDGEREAARAGEVVMFRSQYKSGGRWGTYWRKVKVYEGSQRRYVPRVPTEQEIGEAEHLEQVNGQEGA